VIAVGLAIEQRRHERRGNRDPHRVIAMEPAASRRRLSP
jgi:hypothetical protein